MVHSEEELKMLVTASQEAGVLEEHEEQMLHRVFGFADLTAGQVMVPRTELVAVAAATSGRGSARRDRARRLSDAAGLSGRSRQCRRHPARDRCGEAIAAGDRERSAPGALAREALTVPETLAADDLLAALRRRRVREAIVIDEYGGTAGLVTFESLMERIVGDLGGSAATSAASSFGPTARPTSTGSRSSPTSTSSSGWTSTRTPTRPSAATCSAGSAAAPRVGDTIEVAGRQMRVVALDGLRVAKVWLSTPEEVPRRDQAGRTRLD